MHFKRLFVFLRYIYRLEKITFVADNQVVSSLSFFKLFVFFFTNKGCYFALSKRDKPEQDKN